MHGGGRPRILLVHHSAALGGGTVSLLDVAETLAADHDVSLASPTPTPDFAGRLERLGVSQLPVNAAFPLINHYNGGPKITSRTFWTGLAHALHPDAGWRKLISGYDLIVLNSAVLVPVARVAHRSGKPTICVVRETLPSRSPRSLLLRDWLDRYCDGVLFLSDHDLRTAQLGRPLTGVMRDVLRPDAWPRYSRRHSRAALGLPQEQFGVLFLGGTSPLKNLPLVLRALQRVDRDDVHLLVAGPLSELDTPAGRLGRLRPGAAAYRYRLERALSRGPRGRVHLLGPLDDPSLAYSAADVVVFSASKPHQGRPIFEAGWYGLPALAPAFPNLEESLIDGETGLFYRPHNAASLAQRITELAADADLHRRLGRRNRAHTERTRDPGREGVRLLRMITQVLGRGQHSGGATGDAVGS